MTEELAPSWFGALAALAALAFAGGAPGAAADSGAKSKIVIKKLRASGAAGKVTSEAAACEPNRKVTLFKLEGFRSVKVKITSTDSQGDWRVKKDLERDRRYFAKVDSRSGCRYDVSRNERL